VRTFASGFLACQPAIAAINDLALEKGYRLVMRDELIEPVPVDDVFVTGVGRIEDLGNYCIRVWLYAEEGTQKVVKAKLIMPIECAVAMNTETKSTYAAIYCSAFSPKLVAPMAVREMVQSIQTDLRDHEAPQP
jgi:hypothetical protein